MLYITKWVSIGQQTTNQQSKDNTDVKLQTAQTTLQNDRHARHGQLAYSTTASSKQLRDIRRAEFSLPFHVSDTNKVF